MTSGSPPGALGRIGQHVGAAGDAGRGGVAAAVQGGQRLARQHQRHGLVPDRHDHPPGLDDLVGVAGPHVDHAGHGADRGDLLDGLVGGPVLADADRVVGVDVDQREFHQRREPQRAALEVGEDEEPGLVGAQLGQREPVADRRGGVLADPEVQVATGPVAWIGVSWAEVAGAVEGQARLVRRRQVRRPADQPRHPPRDRVEHLAARVAAGDALRVGRELRQVGVPSVGQRPALHVVELLGQVGVFGGVAGEQLLPLAAAPPAVLCHRGGEVLLDPVGDEEGLVLGPVVEALGGGDLVRPEGLAVRGVGALLVRGAVADDAVDDDQRRPVGLGLERLDRGAQRVEVVGVGDVLHRPAEPGEAGRRRPR